MSVLFLPTITVVDELASRVTAHVLDMLGQVEAGTASAVDFQASVAGAVGALDNANRDLRAVLERLDADLETIAFTVDTDAQPTAVREAAAALLKFVDTH